MKHYQITENLPDAINLMQLSEELGEGIAVSYHDAFGAKKRRETISYPRAVELDCPDDVTRQSCAEVIAKHKAKPATPKTSEFGKMLLEALKNSEIKLALKEAVNKD